ncbi:helix-turn-helix domain-containing protein [Streptomyces sennicomposti]
MSGSTRDPLPPSPGPQMAYLAKVLRELKDRSGLSLTALAARTPYSRSSWDRYLRGLKLPPQQAVQMLGRLAGGSPERLAELWKLAEAESSGRDAGPATDMLTRGNTARPAPPEVWPRPPLVSGPSHRRATTGWIGLGAVVAAVVVAVAWACVENFRVPSDTNRSVDAEAPDPVPLTVGCWGDQCTGRGADAMACDIDATSAAGLQIGRSRLDLRVSRNCAAAWARLSYSSVGDRVRVEDRVGAAETVTVVDQESTDQYVVTPMLSARSPAQMRACWEPRGGGRRCTSWGPEPKASRSRESRVPQLLKAPGHRERSVRLTSSAPVPARVPRPTAAPARQGRRSGPARDRCAACGLWAVRGPPSGAWVAGGLMKTMAPGRVRGPVAYPALTGHPTP